MLKQAVLLHEHVGDIERCPVCEGDTSLDATWRERAEQRIREAETSAKAAREAEETNQVCLRGPGGCGRLFDADAVTLAEELGLSQSALETWKAWISVSEEEGTLLARVKEHSRGLCATATEARELAAGELERRNEL